MGDLNHIASTWFISGSCEQYLIVPTADGKEPFLEQVFNLLGNFLEVMAGKNIYQTSTWTLNQMSQEMEVISNHTGPRSHTTCLQVPFVQTICPSLDDTS